MSNKLAELLAKRRLLQDEADERGEGFYMSHEAEKTFKPGLSPRLNSDDIASAWDNMTRKPPSSYGGPESVNSPPPSDRTPLLLESATPENSENSPEQAKTFSTFEKARADGIGKMSDNMQNSTPETPDAANEVTKASAENFSVSSSTILSPRSSASNLGTGR